MEAGKINMVPIKVECHSGYKADEYPRYFFWNDRRYEIREILDRWYQSDRDPEWSASDYFKVEPVGGGTYLLKHDLEHDCWYLCQYP